MYNLLLKFSHWLSTYTSWFIITVALVTYFVPELFTWVHGTTQSFILGFIMLTLGLTLTMQDMRVLAARPWDILIGTCAQFSLMPLIAWSLTVGVGYLGIVVPKPVMVGIILVGCCPGGVSSNIMSYLCRGDVAFPVGMTTVSTLLAPIVTPLLVLWLAGEQVEVDALGMFLNILIVTLMPVTIGFFANLFCGTNTRFRQAQAVMPRQTAARRRGVLPHGLRRSAGSQLVRIPHRLHRGQAVPLFKGEEQDHLHRGGYAERGACHSAGIDFLRHHLPLGSDTLRTELRMAPHIWHNTRHLV